MKNQLNLNKISDESVVILFGWNRPELIAKRLQEMFVIAPKHLFVSIDFYDSETTHVFRRISDQYIREWPPGSNIKFIFHKENLGLVRNVTETIADQFLKYKNVIVIEDDVSVSRVFLDNLYLGLSHLENSREFLSVGSFSPLKLPKGIRTGNYFRSSRYFSCWGWATNRESWSIYDSNIKSENFADGLKNSRTWNELSDFQKKVWISRFERVAMNPYHTWDIQVQYASFKYEKKHLLPLFRFSENEGFSDSRSTHTTEKRPWWMGKPNFSENPIKGLVSSSLINMLFDSIDSETLIGDRQYLYRVFKRLKIKSNF